jgi:hypothetical protein
MVQPDVRRQKGRSVGRKNRLQIHAKQKQGQEKMILALFTVIK